MYASTAALALSVRRLFNSRRCSGRRFRELQRSSVPGARDRGVHPLFDYRTTDLSKMGDRVDVVYDTAGTMKVKTGLGLLRAGGVFLDINPTPGKFVRAIFSRRLEPIICTPRADILDGLARAAGEDKLRLPISEIVPLSDAIRMLTILDVVTRATGRFWSV
ncbi:MULTISPECIES: zinc-binding dehydrogenase [Rhizobium]|uniref:Uncharacterized protein n=1 Tax=Rhizobium favelukesii TaxID=348824 RepID=W6RML9_9HYPH|nr:MULTISPECIES: zinc-binding dehydrogenase [Rhizobium]CDM62367.1 hypothetical protein LPU83_pLPU83d_0997 [Rhizobium favelukesii]